MVADGERVLVESVAVGLDDEVELEVAGRLLVLELRRGLALRVFLREFSLRGRGLRQDSDGTEDDDGERDFEGDGPWQDALQSAEPALGGGAVSLGVRAALLVDAVDGRNEARLEPEGVQSGDAQ